MSYLITASDGISATWVADAVRRAASAIDPSGRSLVLDQPGRPYDLIIDIAPAAGSGFQIRRDSDGTALTTDGTLEQAAHVAAWARLLLPQEMAVELWLVDQAYTHKAVVAAGASAAEIAAAFQPIG